MMPEDARQELERFAEGLMRLVRDRAIAGSDQLASGKMRGPTAERWRSVLSSDEAREAVKELIPDIVDRTLFELLNATDNDELPLGWQSSDGSCVSLETIGLGEMAGWFVGSPGLRHAYSLQRFFDAIENSGLDPEHESGEEK